MYEASFGLKRRPFAATPDATCFLTAGPVQAAFDEIVVCVEQGQGIAVLTAPAGIGKTLLCERLRSELDDRFETVFLRHASFLTRRALLQTVLCELNHAYHHPSEQELRLELLPAIRALQPKREALVLICDEAHQLTDSLIEELRILADFAESGRPLVRLVLVGQLSLEEKLAQPSLEAFNQRIRAHVNLPTFDREGSKDYIDYRLTWAGGRTDEIFTPAALELISHASDGIPRCINQLADHTLLLAFVAEQRPAGEGLVREALNDLRQLPLHWNESSTSRSDEDHARQNQHGALDFESPPESHSISDSSGYLQPAISGRGYSYEPAPLDKNATGIEGLTRSADAENAGDYEVGADADPVSFPSPSAVDSSEILDQISVKIGSDDWRHTVDLFSQTANGVSFESSLAASQFESAGSSSSVNKGQDLTVPGHFHDLVRDSYIAAERNGLLKLNEQRPDEEFNSHSNAANIFGNSLTFSDSWGSVPSIISSGLAAPEHYSGVFHEEVIVDRYASIDAGFTPPSIPVPDTTNRAEVHTDHTQFQNCEFPQVAVHSKAGGCEVQDFTDLDESNSLVLNRDTAVSVSHDPLDMVLDAVHSLIEVVTDNNREASHESQPLTYAFCSVKESNASTNKDSAEPQRADDTDRESVYRLSTPRVSPAWEAVETEPVDEKSTSRPFRYLFSTLRRKQQERS